MTQKFTLALAQLNPCVGDFAGNMNKAITAHAYGRKNNADLVVLPEMFLSGYQTQDLVLKPAFVADAMAHLTQLMNHTKTGPALGIGAPMLENGRIYDAYHILSKGKILATMKKHELPNTDVFDEKRLFSAGDISGPYNLNGIRIGSPICEDAWHVAVCETMAESGAELFIVCNGSPYQRNKLDIRLNNMVARVIENDLPLVYLNMVGGQDDLVFDGGSFVLNRGGDLAMQLPVFTETCAIVEFENTGENTGEGWTAKTGSRTAMPDEWEQDYHAMVLGLRDYMAKTGFETALIGLSGGVDSALVATIATDALGAENVRCVMMPSEYTSAQSLRDAGIMAESLGCAYDTVPIDGARDALHTALAPLFKGKSADTTEENLQSRLRAVLLMAISNKDGGLLLSTGNKSEVAVGYATIYGDMAGGYNPIKDLYKTRVFETCRWRNANHRDWMCGPAGVVIATDIIEKPPSAELRAGQLDSDSLPDYAVLDAVLELLIERDCAVADIIDAGFDEAMVRRVAALLYAAEHKRFQSAPGPRLTEKAFWLDRRYPLVNKWNF